VTVTPDEWLLSTEPGLQAGSPLANWPAIRRDAAGLTYCRKKKIRDAQRLTVAAANPYSAFRG